MISIFGQTSRPSLGLDRQLGSRRTPQCKPHGPEKVHDLNAILYWPSCVSPSIEADRRINRRLRTWDFHDPFSKIRREILQLGAVAVESVRREHCLPDLVLTDYSRSNTLESLEWIEN
ncbi:hypothetical protein BS50DRAFT_191177 [Corynespora cassiicola Philippines]|uniref:Uncharacterized protein n=1 Tax=Corynespora cassiicola Philippines TaxID=1448308 RepID=A0A2T2P7I5_CORCC|nr:hypothetical protein BS50DRAFT_191177 [Corynespora cassiicola Philippines]